MAQIYPEWKRLVEILQLIKSQGVERLEADEIIEFGKLYRRAAAELSFHRTHEADPARVAYLNDLLGQCYPYVYAAPRQPLPNILRFFTTDYPRAFRKHALWILLAFLLSIVPATISFFITWQDRALAYQILPAGFVMGIEEQVKRHQENNTDWMPLETRPAIAAFLPMNNISVSIMAYGGGMTGGILTGISMIQNGIMLGVVAAGVGLSGPVTATNFWAFVAPHGVFELSAIFIAGGAGLLLAYALINPGPVPRRIALRQAGFESLKLMLGVTAMLLIAGGLEAFFSPAPNIPPKVKFIVAGCEFVLLFGYLLFAGRRADDTAATRFGTLQTPLPPL